jgi:hypothetical protein
MLAVFVCLLIAFGLFPPWFLPSTQAQRLIGVWHAESLLRQGVRTPLQGVDYEFRSDYTTRRLYGDGFGIQAGLWLIHLPADNTRAKGQSDVQSTTTITATYMVIDSLARHIESHMLAQTDIPPPNVWGGTGIYELTLDADSLVLRIPDSETTGWIEITCTRAGAITPAFGTPSSAKQ